MHQRDNHQNKKQMMVSAVSSEYTVCVVLWCQYCHLCCTHQPIAEKYDKQNYAQLECNTTLWNQNTLQSSKTYSNTCGNLFCENKAWIKINKVSSLTIMN